MKMVSDERVHACGAAMPRILKEVREEMVGSTITSLAHIEEDGEYPTTRGFKLDEKTIIMPGYDDEGNPGECCMLLTMKGASDLLWFTERNRKATWALTNKHKVCRVGYAERHGGMLYPCVELDNGIRVITERRGGEPGTLEVLDLEGDFKCKLPQLYVKA